MSNNKQYIINNIKNCTIDNLLKDDKMKKYIYEIKNNNIEVMKKIIINDKYNLLLLLNNNSRNYLLINKPELLVNLHDGCYLLFINKHYNILLNYDESREWLLCTNDETRKILLDEPIYIYILLQTKNGLIFLLNNKKNEILLSTEKSRQWLLNNSDDTKKILFDTEYEKLLLGLKDGPLYLFNNQRNKLLLDNIETRSWLLNTNDNTRMILLNSNYDYLLLDNEDGLKLLFNHKKYNLFFKSDKKEPLLWLLYYNDDSRTLLYNNNNKEILSLTYDGNKILYKNKDYSYIKTDNGLFVFLENNDLTNLLSYKKGCDMFDNYMSENYWISDDPITNNDKIINTHKLITVYGCDINCLKCECFKFFNPIDNTKIICKYNPYNNREGANECRMVCICSGDRCNCYMNNSCDKPCNGSCCGFKFKQFFNIHKCNCNCHKICNFCNKELLYDCKCYLFKIDTKFYRTVKYAQYIKPQVDHPYITNLLLHSKYGKYILLKYEIFHEHLLLLSDGIKLLLTFEKGCELLHKNKMYELLLSSELGRYVISKYDDTLEYLYKYEKNWMFLCKIKKGRELLKKTENGRDYIINNSIDEIIYNNIKKDIICPLCRTISNEYLLTNKNNIPCCICYATKYKCVKLKKCLHPSDEYFCDNCLKLLIK
jgi:hypothetical protein